MWCIHVSPFIKIQRFPDGAAGHNLHFCAMTNKVKVLLAGQNLFLDAKVERLETLGYITIVGRCRSGEECLNNYSTLNPDLIIIDILPGMSQVETARMILEQDNTIKIILTNADQESVERTERELHLAIDQALAKN